MRLPISSVLVLVIFACGDDADTRTTSSQAGGAAASAGGGGAAGAGGTPGSGGAVAAGAEIACAPGGPPCDAAQGEYCCFPLIAMPSSCETDEAACDTTFAVLKLCDGPEDCHLAPCCYTRVGRQPEPNAGRAECATSCAGSQQSIVCHVDRPDSCPAPLRCSTAGSPLPVCQ
jgi:hypothetical protein